MNADQLIRAYAPEVRLHPNDNSRPASIDWLLPQIELRYYKSKRILLIPNDDEAKVTMNNLIRQNYNNQDSGTVNNDNVTNFFLSITSKDTRAGQEPDSNDLIPASCYAHLRPAPNSDAIDIQYWFFYPYNDEIVDGPIKIGKHEGDWEHVTVRITPDGRNILGVYFARHSKEGRWENFETTGDDTIGHTHPIVYSAIYSHASYPTAKKQSRDGLPDDHTKDGGPYWKCWEHIINVGEKEGPLNGQLWLQFTGRWGGSRGGGPFGQKSPETPSFKDSWKDDGGGPQYEIDRSPKWLEPVLHIMMNSKSQ